MRLIVRLPVAARIRIIISTLVSLIVLGTFVFHYLEPFTWIQAFYFTVSTITTVGYGDLIPSNDLTRLVVSVYMLVSVSLYVSLVTQLGISYLEYREERVESKKQR